MEQNLIQIWEKYIANNLPMVDAFDEKLPHTPPMLRNKQDITRGVGCADSLLGRAQGQRYLF